MDKNYFVVQFRGSCLRKFVGKKNINKIPYMGDHLTFRGIVVIVVVIVDDINVVIVIYNHHRHYHNHHPRPIKIYLANCRLPSVVLINSYIYDF